MTDQTIRPMPIRAVCARGVGWLLGRALATACGCPALHWRIDVTRRVAGTTVRAELRSGSGSA